MTNEGDAAVKQIGSIPMIRKNIAVQQPLPHAVPFYFFLRAITLYTAMAAMVAT